MDDPIFLHDKEFRILRCNKAYQRCAGMPFKQIIGQFYYEVFPKNHGPLSSCLRALEEEAEVEEDVLVGDAIYRSRAFAIHDEHGDYLHSMHILEDITESRRAEAELYENEEKLNKITASAQDAIIMMGADRCISFWNAAAERIFGYTAEETLGQELHALIAPQAAQAAFARGFPHFVESGNGPFIGKIIHVIALRKGGEEFPAELSISATRLNGQWHAIAVVRDITERKQAEAEVLKSRQQAQHYLDIVGVMLVSLDAQGKVRLINNKGCQMLGYSEADILGKDWFENYLPESERQKTKKIFTQMIDGNDTPVEYQENKILTSSGDTLMVAWHNAALLDESGKINGVLSSGEDVTEGRTPEYAFRSPTD